MEEQRSNKDISWVIDYYQAGLLRRLERAAASRMWPAWVTVIGVLIAYFVSFPNYHAVQELASTPYGKALLWWLEHPLGNVPVEEFFPRDQLQIGFNAGCSSHCDKLTFRCVLPLINRVAPFGLWTLVAVCHVAGVAILLLVYLLTLKTTKDRVAGSLATWAVAASFAGSWGFHDIIFGDALAVMLLLSAMLIESGWVVGLLVLLAGFTDERSIIAAPLAGCFHWWQYYYPANNATVFERCEKRSWSAIVPIISGILVYVLIRLILTQWFHLSAGTSMLARYDVIHSHLYEDFPVKIFGVFKLLWIAPLLFVLATKAQSKVLPLRVIIYIVAMLLASMPAMLVWDIDRSLYYLLPGIVISLCFWQLSLSSLRMFLQLCLVGAIFWVFPGSSAVRYVEDAAYKSGWALLHSRAQQTF